MSQKSKSFDQDTFNRLRRLYLIALGAIALSVLASQLFIRSYLSNQENDSRLINMAGRQRMLSQKLSKEAILLAYTEIPSERNAILDSIQITQKEWNEAHQILKFGDENTGIEAEKSEELNSMFDSIQTSFDQVNGSIDSIKRLAESPTSDSSNFKAEIKNLLTGTSDFLPQMERIVNQYDQEAKEKVSQLKKLEITITMITILILLGEFLVIFWPSAKAIKGSIKELMEAEKKAVKMAKDADALSQSKEKSVRELRALSQAMDQILLFARITPDGYVSHLGDQFSKLLKVKKFNLNAKFSEIISINENERLTMDQIISENKKSGWQGEVKASNQNGKEIWLDFTMLPFHSGEDKSELIIVCLDITKRKEILHEVERLTKESYEERIHQQKIISRKIIENQENEQNRIAKDIHDGIGQMLTGLKYLLESVDLSDIEKAQEKIEKLKLFTSNIIKGVRTATFNLTPPELTDYGLVPALTELTQELSKLTDKNIVLFNKTDFNQRLDNLTEINLYRITQEAINNAIKYAESSHIIVTISHSESILSIIVDDNGKGFDKKTLKPKPDKDGGMGLTFMQERINYINGRLFINSAPNQGTRVTLNVPIA
ncbi:ATP-binding protein [Algoriphagus zhangzhouensis]|uniref:Oxygen sensor histidine kinase NreB n=1 Tax=Algoriphagus zhangzhouensis TaxID=1073327 RepID=A0A1M7ZAX9_9BACT|nr:ATP-binding protein [Algoriphagus zhangzhouensis]TDY47213.1 PAS domain-containing protein [Algoriphagus zhangzhouensis]SHO61826.1 Histidine kinase [Algoriphagus zhangzhouensis]